MRVHHLRADDVDQVWVAILELVKARLLSKDLGVLRLLSLPLADQNARL